MNTETLSNIWKLFSPYIMLWIFCIGSLLSLLWYSLQKFNEPPPTLSPICNTPPIPPNQCQVCTTSPPIIINNYHYFIGNEEIQATSERQSLKNQDNGEYADLDINVLYQSANWQLGSERIVCVGNNPIDFETYLKDAFKSREYLQNYQDIIVVGAASQEGHLTEQQQLSNLRINTLSHWITPIMNNLNAATELWGLNIGQYLSSDQGDLPTNNTGDCIDGNFTANQRRIVILGITNKSVNFDITQEKSLIKEKLLSSKTFPFKLTDYSLTHNLSKELELKKFTDAPRQRN